MVRPYRGHSERVSRLQTGRAHVLRAPFTVDEFTPIFFLSTARLARPVDRGVWSPARSGSTRATAIEQAQPSVRRE